jgi:hypothetical protein
MRQSRAVLVLLLSSLAMPNASSFQSCSYVGANNIIQTCKTSYPSCVKPRSVTPFHRPARGLVERSQENSRLSAIASVAQCIGSVGSKLSCAQAYLFQDQTFALSAIVSTILILGKLRVSSNPPRTNISTYLYLGPTRKLWTSYGAENNCREGALCQHSNHDHGFILFEHRPHTVLFSYM